jgi:hypothetical protein
LVRIHFQQKNRRAPDIRQADDAAGFQANMTLRRQRDRQTISSSLAPPSAAPSPLNRPAPPPPSAPPSAMLPGLPSPPLSPLPFSFYPNPPSGPTQWLFQGPPAQSKFLTEKANS